MQERGGGNADGQGPQSGDPYGRQPDADGWDQLPRNPYQQAPAGVPTPPPAPQWEQPRDVPSPPPASPWERAAHVPMSQRGPQRDVPAPPPAPAWDESLFRNERTQAPQEYQPPQDPYGQPYDRPQDPFAQRRDPRVSYTDPRVEYAAPAEGEPPFRPAYDDHEPESRGRRTAYEPAPRKGHKGLIASIVALALIAGGVGVAAEAGVFKSKKASNSTPQSQSGGNGGPSSPQSTAPPAPTFSDQVPTISDGTNIVQIDHRAVTFPSTVTDAVWSPNGTRLAYIDNNGNVAIADDNGGNVQVLTKTNPSAKRAHPAWGDGSTITYAEQDNGGQWLFRTAPVNGPADPQGADSPPGSWAADASDKADNTAMSTTMVDSPLGSSDESLTTFQIGTKVMENAYITRYINPDNQGLGGYPWSTVADGKDPAINYLGDVVYVGTDGQLWVAGSSYTFSQKPVQITFGANHPTRPAWSPDGKRVAFETTTDVESVAVDLTSHTTSNPTNQEYPKPGVPTYQNTGGSLAALSFSASDPTSASVAVSKGKWLDLADSLSGGSGVPSPAGAVIVAGGSTTALTSAVALAATLDFPLYVTPRGKLDTRVTAELTRVAGNRGPIPFATYVVATDTEIPASADATIKKITGTAPVRLSSSNDNIALSRGFNVPVADSSPITFVVADDDKTALLTAFAELDMTQGNGQSILLTKGSSMPDAMKPILNQVTSAQTLVAIGAEANTALASPWSGKPKLTIVSLTGSTPQALGLAVAKYTTTMAASGETYPPIPTLTVLPTSGDFATEEIVAAAAHEPVLFADPTTGLDTDSLNFAKLYASQLIHIDTVGDPSAFGKQLTTALGSPEPLNVLTNPTATK